MGDRVHVVVVGPCASGKTTLVKLLGERGIVARSAAQEHAGVPTLWRHTRGELLVYLDCSLAAIRQRRDVPWGAERLGLQRQRLADARKHAKLYIVTDRFTPEQVAGAVSRVAYGLVKRYHFRDELGRVKPPRKGA